MTNQELREKIRNTQESHLNMVCELLRKDPDETKDWILNYKELDSYLWELIEKDGSLISGIISACEHYLEK